VTVSRLRRMSDVVARANAGTTFYMFVMSAFGAIAVVLAAIGIYGVMAFSLQQRTSEIGIRLALGATPGAIAGTVLLRPMGVALAGLAVGLAAAFGLTRLIASFLFGVTARDPFVFITVPLLLVAIALVSVWIPARRIRGTDPSIALRCE